MYRIVVSIFFILDENSRERFYKENFLLPNVKPDVIFGMFFLTMNNADSNFQAWDLYLKSYTTRNILLSTKRVKLIGKKEFAAATLDLEYKAFVVYIAALNISSDISDKVHPSKKGSDNLFENRWSPHRSF